MYCGLIYELVVTYSIIQYNYKVSQAPRIVPVSSLLKSLHEGTGFREQGLLYGTDNTGTLRNLGGKGIFIHYSSFQMRNRYCQNTRSNEICQGNKLSQEIIKVTYLDNLLTNRHGELVMLTFGA